MCAAQHVARLLLHCVDRKKHFLALGCHSFGPECGLVLKKANPKHQSAVTRHISSELIRHDSIKSAVSERATQTGEAFQCRQLYPITVVPNEAKMVFAA